MLRRKGKGVWPQIENKTLVLLNEKFFFEDIQKEVEEIYKLAKNKVAVNGWCNKCDKTNSLPSEKIIAQDNRYIRKMIWMIF